MKLKEIQIQGFRSIDNKQGQVIPLSDITVLLGANGSGKSNLVSFFKMLNFMMTGGLTEFVGRYDVNNLLYYGSKETECINFSIKLEDNFAKDDYKLKLSFGLPDRLFISGEEVKYHRKDRKLPMQFYLPSGTNEISLASDQRKTSKFLYNTLSRVRAYQFHDTSETAKIKSRGYIDDAMYLRSDAGNLAAFLKMLKESDKYNKYYKRIVRHIQQIMPQFGDFSLETLPNNDNYIRLNWYEKNNSEYLFGPDQISDGSIRFMALAALFLQPEELMPSFIIVDEPELGLHPSAIVALAGMIRMSSKNAQILIATQSTRLVDEFDLEDIVVVERDTENNCSLFKKLDKDKLKDWINNYCLSELWEKNVLGGKP